jgi:hypothetical protein
MDGQSPRDEARPQTFQVRSRHYPLEDARELGIEPRYVGETLLSPCHYWLNKTPCPLYSARWFRDGTIVFTGGLLTKGRPEGTQFIVEEISLSVVIALREILPAGAISSTMPCKEILLTVARSFGVPVTCDERKPKAFIYEGSWDGGQPRGHVEGLEIPDLQPFGHFNQAKATCQDVWIFSWTKYLKWWRAADGV